MIEPRDIAARVPFCPKCRAPHYTMEVTSRLPLKVKAIRCARCGADIVRAYRGARTVAFGLTIDAIDRLLTATGAVLVVALVLSLALG